MNFEQKTAKQRNTEKKKVKYVIEIKKVKH